MSLESSSRSTVTNGLLSGKAKKTIGGNDACFFYNDIIGVHSDILDGQRYATYSETVNGYTKQHSMPVSGPYHSRDCETLSHVTEHSGKTSRFRFCRSLSEPDIFREKQTTGALDKFCKINDFIQLSSTRLVSNQLTRNNSKAHMSSKCRFRKPSADSGSKESLLSCGCSQYATFPRDNKCSRQRRDYCRGVLTKEEKDGVYLTPLQKKDNMIRELKEALKVAKRLLAEKEQDLEELRRSIPIISRPKDLEIDHLRCELRTLEEENRGLEHTLRQTRDDLEKKSAEIFHLQVELDKKEEQEQDLYLRMYKKGQQSAIFERQEEIEDLAFKNPTKVAVEELVSKLTTTQRELLHWQNLRKEESYDSAKKSAAEADATLYFLKDALFHFLTDPNECEQHLKAMLGILDFTDAQRRKIAKARNNRIRRTLNRVPTLEKR